MNGSRWWRIGACIGPLIPVAVVAGFRLVGETSWPVALLLYIPRLVFVAPLLLSTVAAARLRSRALLAFQVVGLAVALFALMGLRLAPLRDVKEMGYTRGTVLRVVTLNSFYGRAGKDKIIPVLQAARPDVVLLQATAPRVEALLAEAFPDMERRATVDFLVASRFPISEVREAEYLPSGEAGKAPFAGEFVRYTLATPLGPLDVYNVHPFSPRAGLFGIVKEGSSEVEEFEENLDKRWAQVRALATAVHASKNPVIIAGDFNLPGGSRIFEQYLGELQDGFEQVGRGFGYTFPSSPLPWMRIDRILAGPELRFLSFQVGPSGISDHRPVIAEIERN
jgi:endonuclease/exonuclease/phosphatase (EEP) superfamily protein YafD